MYVHIEVEFQVGSMCYDMLLMLFVAIASAMYMVYLNFVYKQHKDITTNLEWVHAITNNYSDFISKKHKDITTTLEWVHAITNDSSDFILKISECLCIVDNYALMICFIITTCVYLATEKKNRILFTIHYLIVTIVVYMMSISYIDEKSNVDDNAKPTTEIAWGVMQFILFLHVMFSKIRKEFATVNVVLDLFEAFMTNADMITILNDGLYPINLYITQCNTLFALILYELYTDKFWKFEKDLTFRVRVWMLNKKISFYDHPVCKINAFYWKYFAFYYLMQYAYITVLNICDMGTIIEKYINGPQ